VTTPTFDDTDVAYLAAHLSEEQLKSEIHSAEIAGAVADRHLEIVRAWLQKQRGGANESPVKERGTSQKGVV
jgi:hypothetical protein